ncbi:ARM repeat-containing protein [Piromyces finnis]|uniref:ARM repeat-containing protein n=1 Tax=Piromyces finnis TaxID=1754191 RepID=A0A1Y1UXL0_9FUNG|nr:ARM repeat-containing protein [Piromyces finnis]|eukprot:ORX42459.1 ARM repeat-containing protein [Piromyces finnis]
MWNFNSWNVELELSSFSNNLSTKSRDINLKEANFSNGALKSEEEINNYSLNETLNSIERAEYILKKGVFLQKEYVYSSLVSLAKDDAEGMKNIIIPLILKNIKDETTNIQKIFGESFLDIIKENLLEKQIIGQFIPLIKEFLQSTKKKDDEFVDLWIKILNEMIPILPEDIISSQLISEMKSNIDLSKPTEFREMCARIMGTLSGYVNSSTLETILFPKIVTLCQDTLYEIRKYMSEQLNQIFKNLKLDSFLKELMSEYIELILDEEDIVRNTALRNVIDIIPDIAKRLDIDIIYPTLKSIISDQPTKYSESIKEKIGLLVWNLKDFVNTDELEIFIKYYISVSISQNEKDCIDYIYNLPCIAFISEQLNYEKEKMCEIINYFCQSKSNAVRISMSKCFHEFTPLYNKSSYKHLSSSLISLLKDNDINVLEAIFKNMAYILGNFSKDPSAKFNDIAKEIINAYNRCKTIAPLNWRAQECIVKNFEYFPKIFNMDIINNHFTPLIFNQLLDKSVVRPVKQLLCKNICIFLKMSKKIEHRDKIHAFLKEMKQSNDYHIRYLYLVICYYSIGIFSSKYFCEYFLYSIIDLYRDPIPNIRIYLCELLISIRHCLFLFNDSSIIQKFNVITNSLIIRNSDDADLNNTNNIINDVLNYPELQKNNKYISSSSFPKDSSNLTINFFMNNDKLQQSKKNSLKSINSLSSNKTPTKVKPSPLKKTLLNSGTNITKSSNRNKINLATETTNNNNNNNNNNNKPINEMKKFTLPVYDTECYKSIYYYEIYNKIDEINFERLISEDKIKEKEESLIFHLSPDQAKRNKYSLLDHFKYNNINQFGKQVYNKPYIKNSIENMSGNSTKPIGGKATSSSVKSDQSSIASKSKINKNSSNTSIKSDTSYSSQKSKILGDEKTTLKPKMIGNSDSVKQSSTTTTTTTRKKIEKNEINNLTKKTTSKNDTNNNTIKKTDNTKKSIIKTDTSKINNKINTIENTNKKKTNESTTTTNNNVKKNIILSKNEPSDTDISVDIVDLSEIKELDMEHPVLSGEINKRKPSNPDIKCETRKNDHIDKCDDSNFLSPSKSSSIWSSSSSVKSSNNSKSSTPEKNNSIISSITSSSTRSNSIKSSCSTIKSSSPASSIMSASSSISASSTVSSISGNSIIKKKIISSNPINPSKPKITFESRSQNSTSDSVNSQKSSLNSISSKTSKSSSTKASSYKSSLNKTSINKLSPSKVSPNKTTTSKTKTTIKKITNSTNSISKKKTSTKSSLNSKKLKIIISLSKYFLIFYIQVYFMYYILCLIIYSTYKELL